MERYERIEATANELLTRDRLASLRGRAYRRRRRGWIQGKRRRGWEHYQARGMAN